MPRRLRSRLGQHEVWTAFRRGWSELSNGALIAAAEAAGFDAMITADRSLRYQQNLAGRRLAILVLTANSWVRIQGSLPEITEAVGRLAPGEVREFEVR